MPTSKNPPATPAEDPHDKLDDAVAKVNEELEALAPDLQADDVVALPEETGPELEANQPGAPLSDEVVDELAADAAQAGTTDGPQENEDNADAGKGPAKADDLDDQLTSDAVDDIVAEEADIVLEAEDQAREAAVPKQPGRLRAFIGNIWASPGKRWLILIIVAGSLLAAALVPHSRYFVLNTVGVRASLQLTVIDNGTRQPLKNVTVRAGGSSGQTDGTGLVKLENVRLGSTLLQIEKRAFAPIDRPITVGWGSNPLGEFRVSAVGTQYSVVVKDFLSGKPIDGAEASSGDGNASSDENGRLVLTLDTGGLEDEAQVSIEITAPGYRQQSLELTVNNKEEQSIDMVPARKAVYVSKRSGNYDVYTAYVDGKDEQRIVSGTGLERDDIVLIPHPKEEVAAFVATRENTRNPSGYLLSTLYILDTQTGELVKIDQSEQIQMAGWSKTGRLVYVKIAAGADNNDPKRHRLMSFNSADFSDTKEIASSNSFNDVLMMADRVYFSPSSLSQENPVIGTFAIDADGKNQQTILDKEVFNMVRFTYNSLYLSAGEEWYSYDIGAAGAKAAAAPTSQDTRLYVDNPATQQSLWVDSRDGKGVLLSYDTETKTDKQLASRSGLKLPAYWLNDTYVVVRVRDNRETADYVLNTEGGELRKITDVTDSAGLDRWFYY